MTSTTQIPPLQNQRHTTNHRLPSNPTAERRAGAIEPLGSNNRSRESDRVHMEGRKRGRGRARGGRNNNNLARGGRNQQPTDSGYPPPIADPPSGLGGGGVFGAHPTKDAELAEGEVASKPQNAAIEDDGEVCFICASPVSMRPL
ncbi:MAG: hypothetical protein Q9183_003542 [Haloplaca sp. 2 TL-2023]